MSNDSANDLDSAIGNCLAAFDEEFKATFARAYAASLNSIGSSSHKVSPVIPGDLESVLPSKDKGDKPVGDPQVKSKKKGTSSNLPLNGKLEFKGEPVNPDKANSVFDDALSEALKQKKLQVHIQDWGVVNMDVEPHVFVQICSTLGDFEAITFRTIDDFNRLHEVISKAEFHTADGARGKKVNMPSSIASLERATLSSKPLKSKAPRFECACRKKTGLEQPHANFNTKEDTTTMAAGVTNASVVSVGTSYNPRACDVPTKETHKKKDKKEKEKKDSTDKKKKKKGHGKHETVVKCAAVEKLRIGNRTLPVWSAPQPCCHCTCPYCCWGEVAAEVLGARLQSYLVALTEHCYCQELVQWLGFDKSCVSLMSFTHEHPGFLSVPAVAAEAIRSLHARTVKDSNAAAIVPAFTNLWQASMNFNTPEEGLTWWIVSELIRTRMTRSVGGDAKGNKRLPDPDGRIYQEWLPGVTPLRSLTKEQIKAREFAKTALFEHVKPQAAKHYSEVAGSFSDFLSKHAPSVEETDKFLEPLSGQLAGDVIGQALEGGANGALDCLTKIVCALLEKHVLTRAVMEPLANVDTQMSQFATDSVRVVSKDWDAEFESGRRALAVATLTGTRYVISSTIASGAFAFSADVAEMLAEQKEQLKPLFVEENNEDLAAGLSCIPTLVRAAMHVILSEVPASFVGDIAAYMLAVEKSNASNYKSNTKANKETLAKKWQLLHQALGIVAMRAGYLLEKSLVAQYVQQSSAEKGVDAKSGRPDPTVPSEEGAKKVKKGKEGEAKPSAMHPYILGFELEGVKKHLRSLSEASAAAYWNALEKFGEFMESSVADSKEGQSLAEWSEVVRRSMRQAFEDSYSRMKSQFCTVAVDMIVQFICDAVSRRAFGNVVRKADAGAKAVTAAGTGNAEVAESMSIEASVDTIVSTFLKPTVNAIVEKWKETALDRFHVVADTVNRAVSFQSSDKLMEGSLQSYDTSPLSLGDNSYSGTGSFTSDDDEPLPEPEEPEKPKEKPVESKVAVVVEPSADASSSSKSSASSSTGSLSSSRSGSRSGSRSPSRSGSRSGSSSKSGSKSSSRSGSVSSKSGSKSGSSSGSRSGSGSKSGSSVSSKSEPEEKKEPEPEEKKEAEPEEKKPEPEPEEKKPEPEEKKPEPEPEPEEDLSDEDSEIVPYDRL